MPTFTSRRPARLLLACLLPLAVACDHDATPDLYPAQITFSQAGLYPEGSQYDTQNRRFLVSSQTAGRLGQVDLDGTYTAFADDAALISTIGLNLDAPRNRLLAAVSDPGYNPARTSATTKGKLAALVSFDRSSGARLSYANLSDLRPGYAAHFANDIAVDNLGNAYVTDSYAPLIYKVDAQGTATVFLENTALGAPAGTFGLNGIVYHPDGYLLVAKSNDGTLFKVPLANPTGFTTVTSTQSLVGADGMLLLDNTTLLVVAGSQNTVFRMGSTDAWATTRPTGSFATGAVSATTIARRNTTEAFVLYPYTATAPRFAITKAAF